MKKPFDTSILSASIVTYHTETKELADCLDMLATASVPIVYVIDNGNEQRIKDICMSRQYVIYMAESNIGYGAAHNKAMRISLDNGVKYHLVINTDIEFCPEDLVLLTDYLDHNPEVALAHPRIVSDEGADMFTARRLPTPTDLLLRRFSPGWFMRKRKRHYILADVDHTSNLDVPYVQGSFMMLRCDMLRMSGLFDERFFLYPEDIDLTRRLHLLRPTMYVPIVKVIHRHRAASYHSASMLRIHMYNMVKYFNKWGCFFDRDRRETNRRLDLHIAGMQLNQTSRQYT